MVLSHHTAPAQRSQERRILVPEGFDPLEHLEPELAKYANLAMAFAHWLTVGDRKPRDPDWYVPFSYANAEKLFGRPATWGKIRDCWFDRGILETDNIWRKDERPLGYRWAGELRRRPRVGVSLTDRKAIDRLDRLDPRIRGLNVEPCHVHLLEWLNRTSFDLGAASRIIDRLGPRRQLRYRVSVQRFQTGVHRPSVSDTTGRFFNTVATMPSRLRPFIRVHGEPLVSNDVTGAQPLCLGLIAFWGEEFTQAIESPAPDRAARRAGPRTAGAGLNTMTANSTVGYASSDLLDYIGVCQSPDFYPELADVLGLPCGNRKERRRVKRACWWLLMGNPERRSEKGQERWDRFARRWPSPAAALDGLKAEGYSNAARTLQRAESFLMVREFGATLMERMPDAPAFLVHDAALTTPGHSDAVRNTLIETWRRWGVTPQLKIEGTN